MKDWFHKHWALNPHPALIPAIEAGWVESIHSFGSNRENGWRIVLILREDRR